MHPLADAAAYVTSQLHVQRRCRAGRDGRPGASLGLAGLSVSARLVLCRAHDSMRMSLQTMLLMIAGWS